MHATLPAIALRGVIAELARQVRSALIEVLNSQYIRTLRAKVSARCGAVEDPRTAA
jgi:peptide/nickel transport system permease protein